MASRFALVRAAGRLAVAAFVVSDAGIRQIAVAARVPAALAGLYPLIVDVVLVRVATRYV